MTTSNGRLALYSGRKYICEKDQALAAAIPLALVSFRARGLDPARILVRVAEGSLPGDFDGVPVLFGARGIAFPTEFSIIAKETATHE